MVVSSSNIAPAPSGSTAAPEVTIVAHDIGDVGGMERQLQALISGLGAHGWDITVLARTCVLPAGTRVRFRRVRGPRRPFVLAYPWFLVAGSLALARRRRGVVQATGAIVLNRVDSIAIHYCHQVGPAHPSRGTVAYRLHARAASLLKRLGERLCLRPGRTRAIVCVSEGVAAEVREHFPALADCVRTIPNGVDTTAFAPGIRRDEARAERARLGLAPEQLVAAFVGSEWERKGLEPALRALVPAPEWTLVVAGSGDEQRYLALARELGVEERVRMLGVRRDVGLVYELADAFLLPTAYETFSLVTFEAAASGLPLLVTAVNGVRELLRDGENGFVLTREPELIAGRLNTLAADGDLRARLGASARAGALAYGWDAMVSRHDELFRALARPRDEAAARL